MSAVVDGIHSWTFGVVFNCCRDQAWCFPAFHWSNTAYKQGWQYGKARYGIMVGNGIFYSEYGMKVRYGTKLRYFIVQFLYSFRT